MAGVANLCCMRQKWTEFKLTFTVIGSYITSDNRANADRPLKHRSSIYRLLHTTRLAQSAKTLTMILSIIQNILEIYPLKTILEYRMDFLPGRTINNLNKGSTNFFFVSCEMAVKHSISTHAVRTISKGSYFSEKKIYTYSKHLTIHG